MKFDDYKSLGPMIARHNENPRSQTPLTRAETTNGLVLMAAWRDENTLEDWLRTFALWCGPEWVRAMYREHQREQAAEAHDQMHLNGKLDPATCSTCAQERGETVEPPPEAFTLITDVDEQAVRDVLNAVLAEAHERGLESDQIHEMVLDFEATGPGTYEMRKAVVRAVTMPAPIETTCSNCGAEIEHPQQGPVFCNEVCANQYWKDVESKRPR